MHTSTLAANLIGLPARVALTLEASVARPTSGHPDTDRLRMPLFYSAGDLDFFAGRTNPVRLFPPMAHVANDFNKARVATAEAEATAALSAAGRTQVELRMIALAGFAGTLVGTLGFLIVPAFVAVGVGAIVCAVGVAAGLEFIAGYRDVLQKDLEYMTGLNTLYLAQRILCSSIMTQENKGIAIQAVAKLAELSLIDEKQGLRQAIEQLLRGVRDGPAPAADYNYGYETARA